MRTVLIGIVGIALMAAVGWGIGVALTALLAPTLGFGLTLIIVVIVTALAGALIGKITAELMF